MPRKISALVFDFDGLILDTETPIFQSWREVYQEHGQELQLEKWATVIGTYEEPFDVFEYLQELTGRSLDRAAVETGRKAREMALLAGQTIRPGVVDYLQSAQRLGLKIGLASSSPCRWVTGNLDRLGLIDHFECIRCQDDVRLTKPDPELYLAAAACLEVSPVEAIAIEDSPNGVTAAKRAGMYAVAVPNDLTRGLRLDHADLRLESLADMPLEDLIAKSQV